MNVGRARRTGVLLAAATAIIALGIVFLSRDSEPQPPAVAEPSTDLPPIKWPDSPYANTVAGEYVGSESCRECHPAEWDSYLGTRHSRSLSPSSDAEVPIAPATVDHQPSHRKYFVRLDGGNLVHEERIQLTDGEEISGGRFPLDLVFGSGAFGHSYASFDQGFLLQSPVTWYAPRAEWGMSPGYDDPHQRSFRRTISTGCLFCHAGIVEPSEENTYRPKLIEHAIGCERCHGPGSLHIAHHAGSAAQGGDPADIDTTIVNPAHLSRELAEDVCQQCHLQSDAHVAVRGRDQFDYRPGLPLSQFRLEFRDHAKSDMTIVWHSEQLHLSRCYQESQGLNCTSCHDPHQPVTDENRIAVYRKACLNCHSVEHCPKVVADAELRSDDNLDCASCHMPRSPTEVPHVAFTHHRIGVHGSELDELKRPEYERTAQLLAVQNVSGLPSEEVERCRGLGWWQLYLVQLESSIRNEYGRNAEESLRATWDAGLRDPDVAAALAGIAQELGQMPRAERFAKMVLEREPVPTDARIAALEILAQRQFERSDFSGARDTYQELANHRREARSWFFLGLCAQNTDDSEAAIAALQRSLEINPAQPGAHQALSAIYQGMGKLEEAQSHSRMAAKLAEIP